MKRSLILSLVACSALSSFSFADETPPAADPAEEASRLLQREQCLNRIQELAGHKAAILNQYSAEILRAQATVDDLGARARSSMSEPQVTLTQSIARRIGEPVNTVNFLSSVSERDGLSSALIHRATTVETMIRKMEVLHDLTPQLAELDRVIAGLDEVINTLPEEAQRDAVRSGLSQLQGKRDSLAGLIRHAQRELLHATDRKNNIESIIEHTIIDNGNLSSVRAVVAGINEDDDRRMGAASERSPYFGPRYYIPTEESINRAFDGVLGSAKDRIFRDMAILSDKNAHFFNIMGGNLDRGRHAAVQLRYGSVRGGTVSSDYSQGRISPRVGVDFYYYKQGQAEACSTLREIPASEPQLDLALNAQAEAERPGDSWDYSRRPYSSLRAAINEWLGTLTGIDGIYRGNNHEITEEDVTAQSNRMQLPRQLPIHIGGIGWLPNNIAVCSIIDLRSDGLPVRTEVRLLQVGTSSWDQFLSAIRGDHFSGTNYRATDFIGIDVRQLDFVRDNLIPSCQAVYDEHK